MITFTKSKLPFGWMGNMSPFPVEHEGKEWRTAEALFQAMRFDDEEIKEAIRAEKSPMGAKFLAKKHADKMTVDQCSNQDVKNMWVVIKLKVRQHPELQEQLLETGDQEIIEDCTKRDRGSSRFWGAVLVGEEWEGQNVLGKLWMKLREKWQFIEEVKTAIEKE